MSHKWIQLHTCNCVSVTNFQAILDWETLLPQLRIKSRRKKRTPFAAFFFLQGPINSIWAKVALTAIYASPCRDIRMQIKSAWFLRNHKYPGKTPTVPLFTMIYSAGTCRALAQVPAPRIVVNYNTLCIYSGYLWCYERHGHMTLIWISPHGLSLDDQLAKFFSGVLIRLFRAVPLHYF